VEFTFINQEAKELLKKFNINDAKEMKTPVHPTTYLGLDEESTKVY